MDCNVRQKALIRFSLFAGGNWGEQGCGAWDHFFTQPIRVYQLLVPVYPLIGQIWQIILTLSEQVIPVTQKDGVQHPHAWNRGIHDNFCVEWMFTRFHARKIAQEGTELASLVNLAHGKDVYVILPTGFHLAW